MLATLLQSERRKKPTFTRTSILPPQLPTSSAGLVTPSAGRRPELMDCEECWTTRPLLSIRI